MATVLNERACADILEALHGTAPAVQPVWHDEEYKAYVIAGDSPLYLEYTAYVQAGGYLELAEWEPLYTRWEREEMQRNKNPKLYDANAAWTKQHQALGRMLLIGME